MVRKPGELTAMISSTAMDLPEHRALAVQACLAAGFFPIGMEALPARDATGIQVSLEMVDRADVYIGVFAWRYGWVPEFDNPRGISITEMEFERALERQKGGGLKEILIFVADESHPVTIKQIEISDAAQTKLNAFKDRACAGRGRKTFKSAEELRGQIQHALSELKERLAPVGPIVGSGSVVADKAPTKPALHAVPPYTSDDEFVGRQTQIEAIGDWARAADPHPVMLFEAIGGTGKSMLTWHWVNQYANSVRGDWKGVFWYSFYERGAVMADFCRQALAYITESSPDDFGKMKTPELTKRLIALLRAEPYLLVLDGLERVLVSYHRLDAAQVRDEEAGESDRVGTRDPCAAIRPEDDELLRLLAAAAPSKILVTTRLTPRVLLNKANLSIPGVRREVLPGLRPADAEALVRVCGVRGSSARIQDYLQRHCDCHALVCGVLAGLIVNDARFRGDFGKWELSPDGGKLFSVGTLDLKAKRNHILAAAMADLPDSSRLLLSTLALLPEAVDYETLKALRPPELKSESELAEAVRDLEQRRLIQFDSRAGRYDLHPVVRAVASARLDSSERSVHGGRLVDYFSSQPHGSYDDADSLEELRFGINLVRTLLQLERYDEAFKVFNDDLHDALLYNLEAMIETLGLLQPFFEDGWDVPPKGVTGLGCGHLAAGAGVSLFSAGEYEHALAAFACSCRVYAGTNDWRNGAIVLCNMSLTLEQSNRLISSVRLATLSYRLAVALGSKEETYNSGLVLYRALVSTGSYSEATDLWSELDYRWRSNSRRLYRLGSAEQAYSLFLFRQGALTEESLSTAEGLCREGRSRINLRRVLRLRGEWQIGKANWELAATTLAEAVRLAHEVSIPDFEARAMLALSEYHLGRPVDVPVVLEELTQRTPHWAVAQLALDSGYLDEAKVAALRFYAWAWADGGDYVRRYELDKAKGLLERLGVAEPSLPVKDPAKDVKFPFEDAVVAEIERLERLKAEGESEG